MTAQDTNQEAICEDLYLRRAYRHKDVTVVVDIDLEAETITLMEKHNGTYRKKNWLFAERQLKYMAGWQRILDAMKYAISEATSVVEKHKEARISETARVMAQLERSK
jgi:hypothetical protein